MMINENNYETYFMSYIDNELNAAERAAVEAFVLTEPKYAEELALFEKTKLHASSNEFIEMEDKIFLYRFPEMDAKLDPDFKKSLYRKEAPVRKIIFTPNVMRASFAIAALFIFFIGIQLLKTNTAIQEKASFVAANNSSSNSKQTENAILPDNALEASVNKINNNSTVLSNLPISNKINYTNITIAKSANANQAAFEDQTIATNNMNTNIVSRSGGGSETNRENDSQNIVVAKFSEGQISSTAMETMATEEEKTILPTNYKEIDTEEEDRNINIGILEIDAAAFRGITRKFSALLKRNKIEK